VKLFCKKVLYDVVFGYASKLHHTGRISQSEKSGSVRVCPENPSSSKFCDNHKKIVYDSLRARTRPVIGKANKLQGGIFMKKQFAAYGALMAQAREVLRAIAHEQNEEIGAINDEHRAMLSAYSRKEKAVAGVIKGFKNKLEEDVSYDDKLAELQKAERELERLNEEFETKWGRNFDEHKAKIARVNAKYQRMHQKTMREAGYDLDAGDAE